MLYLFVDKNQVKLLFQKKTILGQYESAFYEKVHQLNLTQNGEIAHMDFFASAIREALTVVSPAAVKEKEVNLILPQEAFAYMRAEVPLDIANSAITAFIRDKTRAQLSIDIDNCLYDFIIHENETGKQILFYSITRDIVQKYNEAFNLLGLQIVNIIPEPLTYFKLFEKTLRKDKKEFILYASYEKEEIKGYLYDTYGPLEETKITHKVTSTTTLEHILKKITDEYETKGKKLNRLILSGQDSGTIRQDTFTKDVGVWTNPLKRIIPQFYEDYLKILVATPNTSQPAATSSSLPFLLYDVCIGAFIFALENKQFSFFKKNQSKNGTASSGPKTPRNFKFPLKEVLLFGGSFILSFIVLIFIMNMTGNKTLSPQAQNKTPTSSVAAPTKVPASPTPSIDRKDFNVKILNGTGIAGKAGEIKKFLSDLGYGDILTGNADNFDYTTTEIQVKSSTKGLADLIKSDLKNKTANPKITELDEKETAADIVVIFGKDFK